MGLERQAGLTVILPAFNEAEAIGQTLTRLQQTLQNIDRPTEIIVVNDGSRDATGENASRFPIKLLSHPINYGYGRSLLTGIAAAHHETIAIIDADGSYPVEELPKLLAMYDQ